MPTRRDPVTGLAVRGTSNSNQRGSAESRRRRKQFLLETYRANRDLRLLSGEDSHRSPSDGLFDGVGREVYRITLDGTWVDVPVGEGEPAARCFHCGTLLGFETITVDRIIPHCKGGTYRRNNIRPACLKHNSELGAALAKGKQHVAAKKAAKKKRAKALTNIER